MTIGHQYDKIKTVKEEKQKEEKEMKEGLANVKEWFIDKQQDTATRYNCFIDIFTRDEDGKEIAIDGYVTVSFEEIIKESEKAVQVVLRTGDVVGSGKGWKVWIPKSVIKEA